MTLTGTKSKSIRKRIRRTLLVNENRKELPILMSDRHMIGSEIVNDDSKETVQRIVKITTV